MTDELRAFIGECVGEASMCWEHVDRAGAFDAEHAIEIIDRICARIADEVSGRAADRMCARIIADELDG